MSRKAIVVLSLLVGVGVSACDNSTSVDVQNDSAVEVLVFPTHLPGVTETIRVGERADMSAWDPSRRSAVYNVLDADSEEVLGCLSVVVPEGEKPRSVLLRVSEIEPCPQ